MDQPHHGERFLDLVGLKVSNQVPADRVLKLGQSVNLGPKLLRVVFAEVAYSAGNQRPDPFRVGFSLSPRSIEWPRRAVPIVVAASAIRLWTDSRLYRIRSACMNKQTPRPCRCDRRQSSHNRCSRRGKRPNDWRTEIRLVYFEGQGKSMKPFLMIVGFLAAILIVAQLVMGLLILQGQASMRTAHQHSGYLTVAVTLIYIFWSLAVIASTPSAMRAADGKSPLIDRRTSASADRETRRSTLSRLSGSARRRHRD